MTLDIIVPIAICLLSLAAAYIVVPSNRFKKAYIVLTFIAVLIRIAIVSYLYRNGTDTSGTDGLLYHQEGIKVALQLTEGIPFYAVKYSYTWYTVFVGLTYHIFGVNRYIVSYINIGLAFCAALLLLKLALHHPYSFVNSAFISLTFLYFPNLFLWTADSRKEAFLIVISLLCWYCVQRFVNDITQQKQVFMANILRILFVCFLMWLCTLIRIYMFIPLATGIIISQFLLYKKSQAQICLIFTAAVMISAMIIFTATVLPLTFDYHAVSFPTAQTDNMTQDLHAKAETLKNVVSTRNIPISIANYLLLPFPGNLNIADIQGNDKVELIVCMDMFAWYVCLLLMVTGIYTTLKRRESCFIGILAFLGAYIFINALVVEDVADTIYRYRSVIIGTSLLFIDWDILKALLARMPLLNQAAQF